MNIKERKSEVLKTRKVEDRCEEDCKKKDYLNSMNLRDARVWIRYRSRKIAGVKQTNPRCTGTTLHYMQML